MNSSLSIPTPKPLSTRQLVLRILVTVFLVGGVSVILFTRSRVGISFLQRLPIFRVKKIEVQTDWPLTAEQVRSWLPALEGTSLLSLRSKEIALALRAKPWVREVSVKKEYPDCVRVDIETQRPVAMTLIDGKPHFMDASGQVIERANLPQLRALDLPFLTQENDNATWNREEFLEVLENINKRLGSSYSVSQAVLGTYPYFKLFLSNPRIEVVMTLETWSDQWPILEKFLANRNQLAGQLQRINLLFPKKAVVSRVISK